jgi:hypothetical protein
LPNETPIPLLGGSVTARNDIESERARIALACKLRRKV